MASLNQYFKNSPQYQVQQTQISAYYARYKKQPHSLQDVLNMEYKNEDEIMSSLNAFSSVAMRDQDTLQHDGLNQRCIVCNVYFDYDSLYCCPNCSAKYCGSYCAERHHVKCRSMYK